MFRTVVVCLAAFVVLLPGRSAVIADVPAVEPPDFERPIAVRSSLEKMQREIERQLRDSEDWQARRARGVCEDAIQRLEWRRTSLIYDPEIGEAIWRECHAAYRRAL